MPSLRRVPDLGQIDGLVPVDDDHTFAEAQYVLRKEFHQSQLRELGFQVKPYARAVTLFPGSGLRENVAVPSREFVLTGLSELTDPGWRVQDEVHPFRFRILGEDVHSIREHEATQKSDSMLCDLLQVSRPPIL